METPMIYLIAAVFAFVIGGLFYGMGVGRSAIAIVLLVVVIGLAFYLMPWWLALIAIAAGYLLNFKAIQMTFDTTRK